MREAELLQALRKHLPEILPIKGPRWHLRVQLHGRSFDAIVDGELKGQKVRLLIELLAQPNLAKISHKISHLKRLKSSKSDNIPIFAAPYFNKAVRDLCREKSCAYIDLSGSAWLDWGPLLIDKEARKNLYPHESRHKSPFADKASLVIRHLLSQPNENGRVREVAQAVGLSPGYVSKVMRASQEAGYVSQDSKGAFRLRNIPEMLADWSAYYNWRKNESDPYYALPKHKGGLRDILKPLLENQDGYAVSLHAGNNLIEPYAKSDIWHIYVLDDRIRKRLASALSLRPVKEDAGNIVLLKPYYRASALHGARHVHGLRVVSDVQLYLDLKGYPVRGEEAADRILKRRLSLAWRREHAG